METSWRTSHNWNVQESRVSNCQQPLHAARQKLTRERRASFEEANSRHAVEHPPTQPIEINNPGWFNPIYRVETRYFNTRWDRENMPQISMHYTWFHSSRCSSRGNLCQQLGCIWVKGCVGTATDALIQTHTHTHTQKRRKKIETRSLVCVSNPSWLRRRWRKI